MHFFLTTIAVLSVSILFSSQAFSGTVKAVSRNKSQVTVDPDGETYKKGDELCIYTLKNIKVECGTVTNVKSTSVVIKLPSKKNMKKIKKGMIVNPEGDTAEQPATTAGSTSKTGTSPASPKERFSLWMGWSPAVMSPSTFNSVGYYATPTGTPVTTLWEPDGPVASTLVGGAIQGAFPVGGMAIIPGFRYRTFVPNRVDTDYVNKILNPFVSSLTTATAIGLFTDLRYLNVPMGSTFSFFSTGGLDIDMSSLSFKATKKYDTGATEDSSVASAKSSLTVVSLRAGGGFNLIPFKPFGASFGINIILPVVEFGKKFSGTIEETETKGLTDPEGNLKAAIDHKKNKFGLDAQLSILLAF